MSKDEKILNPGSWISGQCEDKSPDAPLASRNLEDLFTALQKSPFRSRFRLCGKELIYLHEKSLPVVLSHAADFIAKRLGPAQPIKDGKQTPWRGHPVFIAQHATATCCRGCLQKWHAIPRGQELTTEQQEYVVRVIESWLTRQSSAISVETTFTAEN